MFRQQSRRELIRWTSAGAAALLQTASAQDASHPGSIQVLRTAGDQRLAAEPSLAWKSARGSTADAIVIDPTQTAQEILGFGAALTDAACFLLDRLDRPARDKLLNEFFHASEANFSVCRLCLGSSDYATKAYTYDEGEPDPEMARFSLEHDQQYIIPILRQARGVNPGLFYFASPWTPPGWMKAGGSMLGGSMRKANYAAYARYFVKAVQGYAAAGAPIDAVSVQNEVDTDQDGKMPACLWGQEYEMEFVSRHLGPRFADAKLDTKIWILDHNYSLWGRAVAELDDPRVNKYVDGIAWHGYVGNASAMTRVHEAYPSKHAYWTEGGPDYKDPHYLDNWAHWGATITGILRNWARCVIAWNLALDEVGKPNIGPFSCGGVVTINSKTHAISRSGQYWALAHFSRAFRRGAKRIASSGGLEGVSHVAAVNPDGSTAVALTNAKAERTVVLRLGASESEILLPGNSLTTLTWKPA